MAFAAQEATAGHGAIRSVFNHAGKQQRAWPLARIIEAFAAKAIAAWRGALSPALATQPSCNVLGVELVLWLHSLPRLLLPGTEPPYLLVSPGQVCACMTQGLHHQGICCQGRHALAQCQECVCISSLGSGLVPGRHLLPRTLRLGTFLSVCIFGSSRLATAYLVV